MASHTRGEKCGGVCEDYENNTIFAVEVCNRMKVHSSGRVVVQNKVASYGRELLT